MLSGFVLMHVYGAKFRARATPFWRPYLAARFARIVPLYLATLLACFVIFGAGSLMVGRWPAHLTWQIVIINLCLLQGWPWLFQMSINIPSWSLSVEMFCYIAVMPLALVLHHRLNRVVSGVVIVALLFAWRAILPTDDSGWVGLTRGITGFLGGALLHQFHVPGHSGAAVTISFAAFAFLILQSFAAWGGGISFLPALTFPFLIQGLASSARSYVHHFFRSPIMLWFGDISYSVYLWQGPVFLATHTVVRPHLVSMPGFVRAAWVVFECAFTLWLSHVSYRRLELPLRNLLKPRPAPLN